MPFKLRIIFLILCVFLFQNLESVAAEKKSPRADNIPVIFSKPDDNDLFVGPGIVMASTYARLYTTTKPIKMYEIYEEQGKNFQEVRQWLLTNVYSKLNGKRQIAPVKAEYYVMLTAVKRHDMNDVLLITPLNSALLGEMYLDKIEELKSLIGKQSVSSSN